MSKKSRPARQVRSDAPPPNAALPTETSDPPAGSRHAWLSDPRSLLACGTLLVFLIGAGWLAIRSLNRPPAISHTRIIQTSGTAPLTMTLQIDQALPGNRIVDVLLADTSGAPVEAQSVQLRFFMPGMKMEAIEAQAHPIAPGHFQAEGQFFTMLGNWQVDAQIQHPSGPALQESFEVAIRSTRDGEAAAPTAATDDQTVVAGRLIYQNNCVPCHGPEGRGDGPAAPALNPQPADFTQHMRPGQHPDEQIYQWIANGVPNSAMVGWKGRLTDAQIWQLVSYLKTFGAFTIPDADEALPPLVFARQANIWLSDGTKNPPRQVTQFPQGSFAQYPSVSPDGQTIAFVVITPPVTDTVLFPTSTLYFMNSDGSQLRTVGQPIEGILSLSSWSPDGKSLVFDIDRPRILPDGQLGGNLLEIIRIDATSGAWKTIVESAIAPALSRDGSQLAYMKWHPDTGALSLEVARPDGTIPRILIEGGRFQGLQAPRFTPDGQNILVMAMENPNPTSPGAAQHSPNLWDQVLGLVAAPVAEAHGDVWDLWRVNIDGSSMRRMVDLTNDQSIAAVSPDGTQIAVFSMKGIYLMNIDGSQMRRISQLGGRGGIDWLHRK